MKPKPSPIVDATMMKPDAVAKWLEVDERNLTRLGVPGKKLGYRTVRYLRSEVIAWLQLSDAERKALLQRRKGS